MSGCARAIHHLFDAERIVANFSSMHRQFPVARIDRGRGPVAELPQGAPLSLPGDVAAWAKARMVTSLLVLKKGTIRHESHLQGTGRGDLRMSWSMAKSVLSTLFGVLFHQGAFDSLDDPAARYAPELADSAYRDVTLRQLLRMTSGVRFDETYLDPRSDIRALARHLGRGGGMDAYALGLRDRHAAPGAVFAYNSIDTHMLGLAIRGATGDDIPALLSRHLIAPLGFEAAPAHLTDARGTCFVLGGLTLTTRDYARFGQMILQGGHWRGRQVVPEAWIEAATRASAPTPDGELGYGYQWWMPADGRAGEFLACGIYGQYLYFDRDRQVLVVTTSANRRFGEDGVFDQALAAFRSLAQIA